VFLGEPVSTGTPRTGLLLYANISKGYKAGAVPVVAASTVTPICARCDRESVAGPTRLGFKESLFEWAAPKLKRGGVLL